MILLLAALRHISEFFRLRVQFYGYCMDTYSGFFDHLDHRIKMCVCFLYVKSLFGYEWCVPKRTGTHDLLVDPGAVRRSTVFCSPVIARLVLNYVY